MHNSSKCVTFAVSNLKQSIMIKNFYELDMEEKLSAVAIISYFLGISETELILNLENGFDVDNYYVFDTLGNGDVKIIKVVKCLN